MSKLERVTIVKNGEYTTGLRKKYTSVGPLLTGEEKCFKEQIDYKKVLDQAEQNKIHSIYKDLNKYVGSLIYQDKKDACIEAMDGLKNAKTRKQLEDICNKFFLNVNKGAKLFDGYNITIKEKEDRTKNMVRTYAKLKALYNNYTDLMLTILIKKITKSYYSMLLSTLDKDYIISLEQYKLNFWDKENVLDNILESLGENTKDSDPDFYNLRKVVVTDMVSKKHDSYYDHLCGSENGCTYEDFKNCAKIYSGRFDKIKIDEFPFITNGMQIEKKNESGEWITSKMLVTTCDFKRSYEVRKRTLNKNRF